MDEAEKHGPGITTPGATPHPGLDWATPSETVRDALHSRKAIRAFLPDPVPASVVRELLADASRAPSGTNTQPWQVRVLAGPALHALCAALLARLSEPVAVPDAPAGRARERHYPDRWPTPYLERRRKVGWDLYGLLGITRADRAAMEVQRNRNFVFFGAPVGLVFTIDRRLQAGSWLDYGMFLQSLMLRARSFGLGTCPQAAFTQFSELIAQHLSMTDHEELVCGMALGYPDPDALVNTLQTERAPVDEFAQFIGFEAGPQA